jgi:predicted transcriptional regulator of viral defense system
MKQDHQKNYLLSWTESLLANGKNTFTYDQYCNQFKDIKEQALISALKRLVQKKKAVSVHRGFYVILKPENYSKGIIPPILFIDQLMAHLERPYYVGLLSAAALHGAAHQRSQEFFVMTSIPHLRPIEKRGIKINYVARLSIPEKYVIERKVETGYVKVSGPELTAIDLVQYQNHIGGLNRAATLISELADAMEIKRITTDLVSETPITYLQRLGYLLENYTAKPDLAGKLKKEISLVHKTLPKMPLKPGKSIAGYPTDKKWGLIINTEIETDE